MGFKNDSYGDEEIELSGEIEHETERAVLFNDGGSKEWLPRQFVKVNGDGTITIPEWLARDRGFI